MEPEKDIFHQFHEGLPIKIDVTFLPAASIVSSLRRFLKKNGHPKVTIKVRDDHVAPYKTWVECDWQTGRKNAFERREDSVYGEFFTKGFVEVWATHEEARKPEVVRNRVKNTLYRWNQISTDMRISPIIKYVSGEPVEGWRFENLNFKKEE